jgi:hypothetical protein
LAANPPPAIADTLADAFASTFWCALALVIVALLVATPLPPRDKPAPVHDPDADGPEAEAAAPVLVH